MCGFVASLTNKLGDVSPEHVAIAAACECMAPRDPDAQGVWQGDGIILGHRRLAIKRTTTTQFAELHHVGNGLFWSTGKTESLTGQVVKERGQLGQPKW